jgi:hypothetical protein
MRPAELCLWSEGDSGEPGPCFRSSGTEIILRRDTRGKFGMENSAGESERGEWVGGKSKWSSSSGRKGEWGSWYCNNRTPSSIEGRGEGLGEGLGEGWCGSEEEVVMAGCNNDNKKGNEKKCKKKKWKNDFRLTPVASKHSSHERIQGE